MNRINKRLLILRLPIQLTLSIILISATFMQWKKYSEEHTSVSISYIEKDMELPSLTICPHILEDEKEGNSTLKMYNTEEVLEVSDFYLAAFQNIFWPGKK